MQECGTGMCGVCVEPWELAQVRQQQRMREDMDKEQNKACRRLAEAAMNQANTTNVSVWAGDVRKVLDAAGWKPAVKKPTPATKKGK